MFSSVDGQVEFYTNSVEHVRITPTGNVGIGTTSPTNRLTVSGNANVTGTSSVGGDSSVGGNLAVTGTITSGGGLVMPTGAILEYGGSSAPTGWLLCNGAAVSRATFAALFAVIGTAYGAGDGFSTFNVPNRQDRVGVGAGLSYARGATGGAVTATTSTDGAHNHTGNTGGTAITTAQMPSHTHTGTTNTAGAHTHNVNTPNTFGEFQNNGFPVACDTLSGFSFNVTTGSSGVHDHAFTTNATGGGATHNHTISTDGSHNHTVSTLQPYLASTFIIKT
jgi:microcystin-dependent protein